MELVTKSKPPRRPAWYPVKPVVNNLREGWYVDVGGEDHLIGASADKRKPQRGLDVRAQRRRMPVTGHPNTLAANLGIVLLSGITCAVQTRSNKPMT